MFRPVAPEEIPEVWSFLEPGIEVIRRRCKHGWTANQIQAALLDARGYAFVCEDGFVVLERCREPITNLPYLNVWLMWFRPGQLKKNQLAVVEWLDTKVRESRCMWWQFTSPRDEWALGIRPYCEKLETTWRRKR